MKNISVCGIDCAKCPYMVDNTCEGCRIVAPQGKCVWGGRCDTHDCAANQDLEHCGQCKNFPCEQLINIGKSENPEGNGIEIQNLRDLMNQK